MTAYCIQEEAFKMKSLSDIIISFYFLHQKKGTSCILSKCKQRVILQHLEKEGHFVYSHFHKFVSNSTQTTNWSPLYTNERKKLAQRDRLEVLGSVLNGMWSYDVGQTSVYYQSKISWFGTNMRNVVNSHDNSNGLIIDYS